MVWVHAAIDDGIVAARFFTYKDGGAEFAPTLSCILKAIGIPECHAISYDRPMKPVRVPLYGFQMS